MVVLNLRPFLLGASVLLAAVVIGCGGGSSSSGSSTPLTSTGTNSSTGSTGTTGIGDGSTTGANSADKYIGTWSGTYATEATGTLDLHGTMTLTIQRDQPTDEEVKITGTVLDALHGSGTVTGIITDFNPSVGSYFRMVFSGPGGYSFKGAPTLSGDGHLAGSVGLDAVDGSIPTDLDLEPVTQ